MNRNMKRQLEKFKEEIKSNLSRSSKAEKNADGLQEIEREVDRYKDILQNLNKRIAANVCAGQPHDPVTIEKRCKKVPEFQLGQLMEESVKDLPIGLLKDVLDTCARVEKQIATEIVNSEVKVENSVSKNLNVIIERHLATIQKQKRVVTKCHQEYEASRQKYDSAQRNSDQVGNQAKITQLKDDQEELHTKLEKERDLYESYMYELLAEEENIAFYVKEYVKHQELYYTTVLREVQSTMRSMDGLFRRNNKQIFNTALRDHLKATDRKIAYVIELCVCCLLEKGLYEEGLLRVGCASSKLRRMISAINANYVSPPLADKYSDPHVVAGVLKKYLRSLPDPLLTFEFYPKFVAAAQKPNDAQRKAAILDIVNQLPRENYDNLRYLTRFLAYLAEKNQENKMSPQNIAIVMSPNLLWSPNENENYMDQVNSTATVNTIVEALVADWSFFFDGEVNFYVSMTRDALFPDNGGFPFDKEQHVRSVPEQRAAGGGAAVSDMMSRSMFVTPTVTATAFGSSTLTGGSSQDELRFGRGDGGKGGGGTGNAGGGGGLGRGGGGGPASHSRSSSHDTSLILINHNNNNSNSNSGGGAGNGGGGGGNGGSTDQLKYRSQSNSSLSDHSSPPHEENSPKLPIRRKHNKQAAPTPPADVSHHQGKVRGEINNKLHVSNNYFKQLSSGASVTVGGGAHEDEGFASLQNHAYRQAQAEYDRKQLPLVRAESHDNLLKLKPSSGGEKLGPPPRPAAVSVDSQVLSKLKASVTATNAQQPKQPNAPNCDTISSSSSNKENSSNRGSGGNGGPAFPLPAKPVALPRTTIMGTGSSSVSPKGPSNATSAGAAGDGDSAAATAQQATVVIREKPVIPERPATLLRPMSFKGSNSEISKVSEGTNTIISGGTSLKKAQSFRGESTTSSGRLGGAHTGSDSKPAATGTSGSESAGTLERTQIYNIDKQQVAFIDVVSEEDDPDRVIGKPTTVRGGGSTRKERPEPLSTVVVQDTITVPQGTPPLAMMESTGSLGSDLQSPVNPTAPTGTSNNNTTTTTTSLQHVPQSPRGMDPKIKRPQVPAPPPPVGRPKSSDSTDL
uniref:Putative rho gtpase-activating protein 92b n=1 Tax=Anopheles triannulatus TaxID=58253 RepID=A0A2M4A1K8_9DIPT